MSLDRPKPSRGRWLIPLAILFVFFAFSAGLALFFLGSMMSVEHTAHGTILELRLDGTVRESPDPLGAVFTALAGPPSLFEIRRALKRAANDDNIAAVKLDIADPTIGWGAAEELVAAIDDFRKSKKPVHAFFRGDIVSDVAYSTAIGADKIWMTPTTTLAVNGLQAEVTFWRGTLDKLGIVPQFFMMKEYKSAGEIYQNKQMSPAFREATTAVLNDIWGQFLAETGRRRKIEPAALEASTAMGLLTATEAQAARLVDAEGYDDQIREELRRAAGTDEYLGLGLRKYLDRARREEMPGGRKRIAVVFGTGVVTSAVDQSMSEDTFSGPVVARTIRAAADDDSVKAILFRVESPGGSAVGSDHVGRAVDYARKKKKPVVVSMSSVAGSGGYWVAMGADAIVAHPSTITGSIGVVFGKYNLRGLYELVGAHIDTIKVGENADILSLVGTFNAAQTQRIQAWMNAMYEEFKSGVAKGRGLKPEAVEEIARGRIWSGKAGRENGLVDALGGYDEAVEIIRKKANLAKDEALELVIYPKPRGLLEFLFSDEVAAEAGARLLGRDPAQALGKRLVEMTRPGAWLLMPEIRVR